jgi:hypothetical protein
MYFRGEQTVGAFSAGGFLRFRGAFGSSVTRDQPVLEGERGEGGRNLEFCLELVSDPRLTAGGYRHGGIAGTVRSWWGVFFAFFRVRPLFTPRRFQRVAVGPFFPGFRRFPLI